MDSPGVRLRDELARRLGKSRCYIVNFPEGCKDANETLMKHGIEGLKECIEFAIPYPIEGTHVATDKSLEMQDIYDNGYPNGAITGWNKFDKFIKFYSGYIGVVSGSPSSGKSNFTDELMIRICIHNDWKFAIFSPENGKMEIHLQRLCEIIIGKPYLPHRYNRMTQNEKDKALAWINDHIYFILPDNESYTIDSILDAAKQLVIRKGIKGLILDPWNALEHSMQGDTETEYTRKMLSRLTYFERNYGLLLLIVAHPTKMRRNSSGRYDICTMYDIAGSANWKNKMEYGFIVHREFSDDYETTKYTDIYIEKVKHIYQGKLGKIRFNYDIQSQRFYEEGEERNTSSFIPTGENYNKVEINKYPLSSHIEDEEPPF
jgi:twinkle protein